MKLFLSYILTFCMVVAAMIPCNFFDHCEDEVITEQHDCGETEDHACKNCSPFSICSPQQGFFNNAISYSVEAKQAISTIHYNQFIPGLESDYHPTLWQPPRC